MKLALDASEQTADLDALTATTEITAAEARTIHFALRAYADQLEGSLRAYEKGDSSIILDGSYENEDKMFLYESLSGIYGILYSMENDYANPKYRELIQRWLNV